MTQRARQTHVPISLLGADAWDGVCVFLPLSALRNLVQTSVAFRGVVKEYTHDALLSLLESQMNATQICYALCLSREAAKALPHDVQYCGHGMHKYTRHIFVFDDLKNKLGGWKAIASATGMRAKRNALKSTNSKDLDQRRNDAMVRRILRLDAWLLKETPLGTDIVSVCAWRNALKQRGAVDPITNSTLCAFLGSASLKAPCLKEAQQALLDFDAAQTLVSERKHALQTALSALCLDRRSDSRLCSAFEEGSPVSGFETPELIAAEMANCHWLHAYTDYTRALEHKVQDLREGAGYYFEGINGTARDAVRCRYTPPDRWPWL